VYACVCACVRGRVFACLREAEGVCGREEECERLNV
jgi:hypothetical protein